MIFVIFVIMVALVGTSVAAGWFMAKMDGPNGTGPR